MRIFVAAIGLTGALLVGNIAQAQSTTNDITQACYAQARRMVLQGEDLANFMKRCTASQLEPTRISGEAWRRCDERTRLLSGEEKAQAMRACTQ